MLWRNAIAYFLCGIATASLTALAVLLELIAFGWITALKDEGLAPLRNGAPGVRVTELLGAAALAIVIGGLIGVIPALFMTLIGAPVAAGISARMLVPYRGARATRLLPTLVNISLGVPTALAASIFVFKGGFDFKVMTIVIANALVIVVAMSWIVSRWSTRWYIKQTAQ